MNDVDGAAVSRTLGMWCGRVMNGAASRVGVSIKKKLKGLRQTMLCTVNLIKRLEPGPGNSDLRRNVACLFTNGW